MARVIVTLKIMPEAVETDLSRIETKATKLITEFGGVVGKSEQEPVAFGIKALKLMFVMNEDIGSTESLEGRLKMSLQLTLSMSEGQLGRFFNFKISLECPGFKWRIVYITYYIVYSSIA